MLEHNHSCPVQSTPRIPRSDGRGCSRSSQIPLPSSGPQAPENPKPMALAASPPPPQQPPRRSSPRSSATRSVVHRQQISPHFSAIGNIHLRRRPPATSRCGGGPGPSWGCRGRKRPGCCSGDSTRVSTCRGPTSRRRRMPYSPTPSRPPPSGSGTTTRWSQSECRLSCCCNSLMFGGTLERFG